MFFFQIISRFGFLSLTSPEVFENQFIDPLWKNYRKGKLQQIDKKQGEENQMKKELNDRIVLNTIFN